MAVKFIGIFQAPGVDLGPEYKVPNGITVSATYFQTGTWAVGDDGRIYQLCWQYGVSGKRFWVPFETEFREMPPWP